MESRDYSGYYRHADSVFGIIYAKQEGNKYRLYYKHRGTPVDSNLTLYSQESVRNSIMTGLWTLDYPPSMVYPDGI